MPASAIQTRRLTLVPATAEHLRAELVSHSALSEALGATVPASWPPQFYDDDAVRHSLKWILAHPDQAGWGLHYVVRRPVGKETPLLVGTGGFKGPPGDDGCVELGYGVVADQRRQGFATEVVYGLAAKAFATPSVRVVVGQTLPSLVASIGVLEKAGFRYVGEGNDPHAPPGEQVIRYRDARYELTRNG